MSTQSTTSTTNQARDGKPLQGEFKNPPVDSITYGPGTLSKLPDLVDRYHGKRVFVIISKTLAKAGLNDQLSGLLKDRLIGTFDQTRQHVPRESVIEAAELARRGSADLLISIGGGTPIDCAKAVALCLAENITRPEQFGDYHVRFTYPDKLEVPTIDNELVPHIAIPTTLSGAEYTNLAGITDMQEHEKHSYSSQRFVPRAVILDPLVAAHTEGWLWAASGMRAVDHAVEGILSNRHMPMMDALGLEALRILRQRLAYSANQPDDLAARMECMLAAWLAIFAITNVGVGLSHGIGHQLAAQFDIIHGITSCIMLPLVMEFNVIVTAPRLRRIAEAMGVDVRNMSDDEAAKAAVEEMRAFVQSLGVPYTLSAVGARHEELGAVADHTLHDRAVAVNPRPITREDLLRLLEAAWNGSRLSSTTPI